MQKQMFNKKGGTPVSALMQNDDDNNNNNSRPIKHLVKKVNNMLDNYKHTDNEDIDDVDIDEIGDNEIDDQELEYEHEHEQEPVVVKSSKKKKILKKNKICRNLIPAFMKEPLLLLILYILVSQPFISNMVKTYIPYINDDVSTLKQFYGTVIYGVLLVVLFIVVRKFLL